MRTTTRALAVIVSLLAICAASRMLAEDSKQAKGISWRTDADKAWAAAKEEQRPLLMFFTTAGCHWCEELKDKTLAHPEVVKEVGKWCVPLLIRGDESADLAEMLDVNSFPTIIILSPDKDLPSEKRVLARWNGFVEQEAFSRRLADTAAKKVQR